MKGSPKTSRASRLRISGSRSRSENAPLLLLLLLANAAAAVVEQKSAQRAAVGASMRLLTLHLLRLRARAASPRGSSLLGALSSVATGLRALAVIVSVLLGATTAHADTYYRVGSGSK